MKVCKWIIAVLSLMLVTCVVLALALPAAAADNLAVNGDLEMGSTNGWEIANATLNSSVKYAGNYSLKLNATSAYSGAAYKIVPVNRNGTVTVSFYYRYDSNPGSGKTYHVYTYQGADHTVGTYSNADKSFTIPSGCDSITTWKQISYTFNAGENDNIYLKFCPGGNGSSACYIDNLVVTCEGGTEAKVDPYLTSFGTKKNRPLNDSYNLIQNGGFESTANAQWNTATFIKGNLSVVSDATAPQGDNSLYLSAVSGGSAISSGSPVWYTFPVTVEKNTQYTFSAWVKSPRLSATNTATATFGVVNADGGEFLVYDAYNGNGHGSATLSTPTMQLMATSPDDRWHLRSVTFMSGTATTVHIAIYGSGSQLYLDDIALFKNAYGIEYVSELRTATITPSVNSGNRYCADEHSLIPAPQMSGAAAENYWSDNPAWRNGFLSFAETGDSHGTALKYTASAYTNRELWYIDWIDVQPHTEYTLTFDLKRLTTGGGRIVLLDDNINSPAEFYSVYFTVTDGDWTTYSVTFDTSVYSRIGFAIVDGGGTAYVDKVRLFQVDDGLAEEPTDVTIAYLKPEGGKTAVMELEGEMALELVQNSGFESGSLASYLPYQGTVVSSSAAHSGSYGAHLKGDGTWGAMLEQVSIPVSDGGAYTFSFWYKALSSGANVTVKGATTQTQYAYAWAGATEWTRVSTTFTVEGDTTLLLNICGGGNGVAESVYVDDISLAAVTHAAPVSVAFLMELDAVGVRVDTSHVGDLTYATVDAFMDNTSCRLVRMGALMTNDATVGNSLSAFVVERASSSTVVDVPAVYLYDVTPTRVSYAVRIVNIPAQCADIPIYARPYYVFERDGVETLVYGDIYSRSYNSAAGTQSIAL